MKICSDYASDFPNLKVGSYLPDVNFALIKTGTDISQLNQQPPG